MKRSSERNGWIYVLPCLALAAWLVAGTIRVIMADPLRDNPFHLPNQARSAPVFLPGDQTEDNHIVVERNYFRSSLQPPIPGPPVPGRDFLEPSPLAAKLIGTVVASRQDWSLALIAVRSETELYRIGDSLLEQASIVAVLSDRVVLQREGRREYLAFSQESTIEVPQKPVQLQVADLVKQIGADTFQVDRVKLQDLLAKPGDLLRKTRITLAFDRKGEVEGIRLVMGRAPTMFKQVGLRNGDIIRRIGPYVINSPERMLEIYNKLKNARELDVELSRGGRTKTLRYRID